MGTVKLRGDKILGKQLRQLKDQREGIASDALWAWAKDVRDDARTRAPNRTGRLRRGITISVKPRAMAASVGTHSGPFYGHLVENGTSETPAQPFLGPAFNAHTDVARYVRTALETRLP